jgi:hypothetical protein
MTTLTRVLHLQVPDGLGCLAQRVDPVNDRGDLAGLDELPQGRQVLLDGRLPGHRDEPVGDEACQYLRLEREGERPDKAAAGGHAPTG